MVDKMFNIGDVIKMRKETIQCNWFKKGLFKVVSYSLKYTCGNGERIIIESKLNTIGDYNPKYWLVNIQCLNTSKRYKEYYQGHFELCIMETSDKKIEKLIGE